MTDLFSGRKIEADFISFLLQKTISDLTSEFCAKCNIVCPVTRINEDFKPLKLVDAVF